MSLLKTKLGLIAALMTATSASAAPMAFGDRTTFVAATAPNAFVDFNDIEIGSSFEGQTLSVGPLSLRGAMDDDVTNRNRIKTGGAADIDGTPYAFGTTFFGEIVQVDFLAPVLAWGADIKDMGDGGRRTLLRFYDADSIQIGEIDVFGRPNGVAEFIGIDLDGAKAARLDIQYYFGGFGPYDDFSMDNIAMTLDRPAPAPAPVPLPAGAVLLTTALGGFGLKRALSKPRGPEVLS